MKTLKYIILSLSCLILSCKNAEYQIIDNSIYISSAANSSEKAETITMNNGADINILVRLAKKVAEDVEVEIKLTPSMLDNYNKETSSEYLPVPNFSLPANAKVIIPAGEISAIYTIRVEDFETNGNRYALGVELGNVLKGNIANSNSQSRFIYLLAKPLRVSVPEMSGVNNSRVAALPTDKWGIRTKQWSLEFWTKMSAYSINNQAIFDSDDIYIRFGDANSPYNYLQIKTLGGQVQTASNLETNKWYHWALVYDGNTLTIYRNGESDVKFQPPAPEGGTVKFDYLHMIASGFYFMDNCQMAQVRLWKKAITQNQIKNNMYFAINAKNPDLIGYWPMDEGSGNTFKDITGNGHDAVAGDGIVNSWIPNVDFKN
ncbi:DUF1735 and LamG domain-containing protein [Sphingobacterium spiritivorum]|nr:DUF1735 and LamG domain-containing protein [Sphingobacterium spiritivorum]